MAGLVDLYNKIKYGGKKGYTADGNVDWSYRGGSGPTLTGGTGADWSTQQWSDFAANGGGIDASGQLISGAEWENGRMVDGTGTKLGSSSYSIPDASSDIGWWGRDGYLSTAGNVLGGMGALTQAYMAGKALDLQEDQFNFEKGLAQTNLANQADLVNEQRRNRGEVGLAMAGSTMDDAQRQAYLDNITAGNIKRTIS